MTTETKTLAGSVWVVSRGSYSDYTVMCACPSRAVAEEVAARYNATADTYGDPAGVEELPLVDRDVQRVEILRMQVNIWDDGTEDERRTDSRVEWPFDALFGAPSLEWRWVRAPVHKGKGGRLEVWGTDHERVRKVYGDRKGMIHADDALRARPEARGRR